MLKSASRGGLCSRGGGVCLVRGGGSLLQGGVCLLWGVSACSGGVSAWGVCLVWGYIPACTEADTPPPLWTDRHLWKYYLGPTLLRPVKIAWCDGRSIRTKWWRNVTQNKSKKEKENIKEWRMLVKWLVNRINLTSCELNLTLRKIICFTSSGRFEFPKFWAKNWF